MARRGSWLVAALVLAVALPLMGQPYPKGWRLWAALGAAGLSEAEVRAARGENFLRAWQAAIDAAAAGVSPG